MKCIGRCPGPMQENSGCLLELTAGGREPLPMPMLTAETRSFLHDGDCVWLRGRCRREGFVPIGFGDCTARVVPTKGRR